MTGSVWEEAVESVLACPRCRGRLVTGLSGEEIRCSGCERRYPVIEGIVDFLGDSRVPQETERRTRETLASRYVQENAESILDVVATHHCIPVMREKAGAFRSLFHEGAWLLDIGIGYGWHWQGPPAGVRVVGVDLSLASLRIARKLLGPDGAHVVLACADAAALPLRSGCMAGAWSVQAFQHFPEAVCRSVMGELERVLGRLYTVEIWNLNPAPFLRAVYRLCRKPYPLKGTVGWMELNRLSADEWAHLWTSFRQGRGRVSSAFSELFFHPDLRLSPRRYPIGLERALTRRWPAVSGLFARQVGVRVDVAET